ncbi:hypothetical protein FB567DRAFT_266533 [Paraphoma chrysanthemicola]|uniref:Uncharacterized protein n=1 Tax=Paraphoma chrysanthemicola TaxID=798071 RepID=A0A8K0RCM5_9PLEO|nr:hypothetical protein FB567DRAFT_266533 [Paraphoma chrysanthemicola]
MKHSVLALALIGAAAARPHSMSKKREVPQEHSHRNILNVVNTFLFQDNPDDIQDSVFGLLGAAAAAEGAGNIADADCLQQATADQAFTNAKAAGDVDGMTNALIFRALERNTGKIGLASVPCTSIQAVNPEIAALQQHQDPAGEGAQELNKQIAAELARQIASVGGDPALANEASTFAPGDLNDPTAAGNTCDDPNDDAGCINSLKLRVDDLSADEIAAAVADVGGAAAVGNQTAPAANETAAACNAAAPVEGKGKGKGKAAKGKGAKAEQQAAAAADNTAQSDNEAVAGAAGADFGACSNPTINFGPTSDGRQQDAFEPADLAEFNHGSALNIAVISNFICSQLSSACKANAAAVSACDGAASAAQGLVGAQAADAFNAAIGA